MAGVGGACREQRSSVHVGAAEPRALPSCGPGAPVSWAGGPVWPLGSAAEQEGRLLRLVNPEAGAQGRGGGLGMGSPEKEGLWWVQ